MKINETQLEAMLQQLPKAAEQGLSGLTAEGKKTVAPAKMVTVTIKADSEILLHNTGETFVELVKELKKKTAKKKKQK